MLIAFEGLDNSGKTTQAVALANILEQDGYAIHLSKELSSDVGQLLRASFKGVSYSPIMKTLLFAADRQDRLEKLHLKHNSNNTVTIFDRYIHSACVYRQSDGLDVEWILNVNRHNPKLDLGLYIDITGEESTKRNSDKKENIHYSIDQLNGIREGYHRFVMAGELILIDGMREPAVVLADILAIVKAKLNSGNSK